MIIQCFRNKRSQFLRCFILLVISIPAMALGNDFRIVNVRLHLPAIGNPLHTEQGDIVNFSHAYLSSFSFELIGCPEFKAIDNKSAFNILSWLIPSAHANHGVRFTKPTQIPVKAVHNLLEDTQLNLGNFKIPVGHYCEINYTLGHGTKKLSGFPVKDLARYSLYLSAESDQNKAVIKGQQSKTKSVASNDFLITADYAFGQNVMINLDVPEIVPSDEKPLQIDITVDTEPALKSVSFTQPPHKIVRQFFLALQKNLNVVVSSN